MKKVVIFWADGSVTILRSRYAEETALHWLTVNESCRIVHSYSNNKLYFSKYAQRFN